jgi:hypothetical protein
MPRKDKSRASARRAKLTWRKVLAVLSGFITVATALQLAFDIVERALRLLGGH